MATRARALTFVALACLTASAAGAFALAGTSQRRAVRIAFSRDGTVVIVRASGGEVTTVAPGTDPAWSPDAQTLAFATTGGIATVHLGDGRLRLHTLDGRDASPMFAPGGSELGVVSGENIVSVDASGGSPRSLGPGTAADWALVPDPRDAEERRSVSGVLRSCEGHDRC